MTTLPPVTVEVSVHASPDVAWRGFTDPESIMAWNFASADWTCPQARNDLRDGGTFSYRMEARDGSFGFDFEGTFLEVTPPVRLRYSLGPDRNVDVQFTREGDHTMVRQSFTPESTHPIEQQLAGWQAILDNYKQHVDARRG